MSSAAPPARPATIGLEQTIGSTPLIRLKCLDSILPGAAVLAKAEHLSPGGSVKDRPSLAMVLDAEAKGLLSPPGSGKPGSDHIVESTGGNTGIGLALVALARGYKVTIVMNNTIAVEKQNLMRTFGCELLLVDPAPFSSPLHYYHIGKKLAEEKGWFYANQFENLANMKAHFETTGREIWEQAGGVDAFVCAAGTGGTIAGISRRLKKYDEKVKVFLMGGFGVGLARVSCPVELVHLPTLYSQTSPPAFFSTTSPPPNSNLYPATPPVSKVSASTGSPPTSALPESTAP